MTDYTQAPTEEFRIRQERLAKCNDDQILGWLTLQKSVMNDYYFDAQNTDWILSDLDAFMHKIYFCWQEAMQLYVDQINNEEGERV